MKRPYLSSPPENRVKRASEHLRDMIGRNRKGEAIGTYAVCSAQPSVLDAAIQMALELGSDLHVESTASQVNQLGGYTGMTPAQFAASLRDAATQAGLPSERLLLGADHLGPYPWRGEASAVAIDKARALAQSCVHAGYQKVHLDASMSCADDPNALSEAVIAERAAILCRAAEDASAELPHGSPRPFYVIGTEVPAPGGEVADGERPLPTRMEDVHRTLEAFCRAFVRQNLEDAWERVIGLVVQPGVEFGDSQVFDYDRTRAASLSSGLPGAPALVYEAHSTDYQLPERLAEMVEDHFAILKVGPALTFAYREAIFALNAIERESLACKRGVKLSYLRESLDLEMLRNPAYWRSYYQGRGGQIRLARAFSFSDRCRYYWPQKTVQEAVARLIRNLQSFPPPLSLFSQYLPEEYAAIRRGELDCDISSVVQHHIRRVLSGYSTACGASLESRSARAV